MRSFTAVGTAHRYWWLAGSSTALALVLLVPGPAGATLYQASVASVATVAAGFMAVGDVRTGRLRNAWTAPYALGAGIQVLISVLLVPHGADHGLASMTGVIVSGGFYFAMGLRGWVGFGDVKFVIGLALIAGLVSGWAGLLLAPSAVLLSGSIRAISNSVAPARARLPHGPALAAALITTIAAGCSPWG